MQWNMDFRVFFSIACRTLLYKLIVCWEVISNEVIVVIVRAARKEIHVCIIQGLGELICNEINIEWVDVVAASSSSSSSSNPLSLFTIVYHKPHIRLQ